ncbi:GntR family transcriptional regulator [Mesobacillus maritimus]|uniref:GntR family transcriptional regulator n=1 Tax=Mesobacillus maritimus TaxID=1643336 RepID=UPI00203F238B|nr:GntR family transcriptional regulator [Mesobacillus maritimus]MCM3585341.1 GntR family transcriptional regulator [Mesobacillus maritimus]MCM3668223.1 GntR family transcriptional regulator [Mesobacillus maritimus]
MSDLSIEKQAPYYIQFYHMIRQMIFDGKYQPGERINETQLAKEHNVSKSPIREAVRILEKEGLLVVENSKVFVYEPTLKDVKDIYYCRMALESFAVRLTTKIASDQELAELEQVLADTEAAIQAKQDDNSIITLNEKFHQLILTFTNNAHLQKQVYDLKGLIHYFRVLNFKGNHRAEDILQQHQLIFSFIKQRDEDQAAQEMINHLELDTEHLVEVLATDDEK